MTGKVGRLYGGRRWASASPSSPQTARFLAMVACAPPFVVTVLATSVVRRARLGASDQAGPSLHCVRRIRGATCINDLSCSSSISSRPLGAQEAAETPQSLCLPKADKREQAWPEHGRGTSSPGGNDPHDSNHHHCRSARRAGVGTGPALLLFPTRLAAIAPERPPEARMDGQRALWSKSGHDFH